VSKPVLIVQHEPSVPAGLIAEVLEQKSVPFRVFKAWEEVEWPAAEDLAGLIVLGGTMNVDELDRYPFLRSSRALMSEAVNERVPTLGVCLGSQMLSRVLGGDVRRADKRTAGFSGVKVTDEGASDPVLAPFATGLPVLQFHEDTFTVPDDAVALAHSESSGLAQVFRFGDRAYAVQFHFEVDRAILEGWVADIGEPEMTEGWGTPSAVLLESADEAIAAQDEAGRELVRRFLDLIDR
jgi:GMP synthase-like glutamine amidotransferase